MWDKLARTSMNYLDCSHLYNLDSCHLSDEDQNFEILINYKSTRKALHVGKTSYKKVNPNVLKSLKSETMKSELSNLEFLLDHDIKVLQKFKRISVWVLMLFKIKLSEIQINLQIFW